MLLNEGNPYRPQLPAILTLSREDFEFAISQKNDAAMGQVAEWQVLAYLAADCDLASPMYDDLLEMKTVGSGPDMHVCALFDGPLLTDAFFARLCADTTVREDVVLRWRELPTHDKRTLIMAIQVAAVFPGRRRLLFLAGHGNGWKGVLKDENLGMARLAAPEKLRWPAPREACEARLQACQIEAQESINRRIESVSKPAHGRYDILAFDACYMGNIETVATFADQTEMLVVSEDKVPGAGFPYGRFLGKLAQCPGQPTEDVALELIRVTAEYFAATSGTTPVTHVMLRSAALPPFADAFVQLARELTMSLEEDGVYRAVRYAFNMAYRFGDTGYMDLKGFVLRLREHRLPARINEGIARVLSRWDELVMASAVPGTVDTPNGLSIYAPTAKGFELGYLDAGSKFQFGLRNWPWFLAHYYLRALGEEAMGSPLIVALAAKMEELVQRGEYLDAVRCKTA